MKEPVSCLTKGCVWHRLIILWVISEKRVIPTGDEGDHPQYRVWENRSWNGRTRGWIRRLFRRL